MNNNNNNNNGKIKKERWLNKMNHNVINFYLLANQLKNVIRTGWIELKISKERLESVAEHAFGCMVLLIGLDSEKKLDIDMLKTVKMIIIKQLEKVDLKKEFTPREYPTAEERKNHAFALVKEMTKGLMKQEELMELLEEIYQKETKEAQLVDQLTKSESDLQAKIYDLEGYFSMEDALEDAKYYGEELSSEIIPQMKNASDGFILFDRRFYNDELFKSLSEDIQNLEELSR